MRISDWSSDVCSSDLAQPGGRPGVRGFRQRRHAASVRRCRAGFRSGGSPHLPGRGTSMARGHPALDEAEGCACAARPRRRGVAELADDRIVGRSEEPTYELQSLMRITYAVFCLKKKKTKT